MCTNFKQSSNTIIAQCVSKLKEKQKTEKKSFKLEKKKEINEINCIICKTNKIKQITSRWHSIVGSHQYKTRNKTVLTSFLLFIWNSKRKQIYTGKI